MRKDEIELRVQGDPNEIDLDSVARALSAFDKFLKAIPGPVWKVRELRNASSGFAVVADAPTQEEREGAVKDVRQGVDQILNDSTLPDGWMDTALDRLLDMTKVALGSGNEGVLLTLGGESIDMGDEIASTVERIVEQSPHSFGSATGVVDRFIARKDRREFGLMDSGQNSPITVTFPPEQMDAVRESIGKKVTVWGMLKRAPSGKKWKLKMERLEQAEEAEIQHIDVDEIVGIFGPEWTNGLSSVEWVRSQRDQN